MQHSTILRASWSLVIDAIISSFLGVSWFFIINPTCILDLYGLCTIASGHTTICSTGGLVKLGLTLTWWIKPLGLVVTPPLLESQAKGRLIV